VDDTPNNVITFPMTRQMRFRHSVNKVKDATFGPEQVTYEKDDSEPKELVEGALDKHIEAAQSTPEYQAIAPRPEHFEKGQEDAVPDNLHHINEGREIKRRKELDNE
jgi:hypothetical protein